MEGEVVDNDIILKAVLKKLGKKYEYKQSLGEKNLPGT
jgi:hypothetical protein